MLTWGWNLTTGLSGVRASMVTFMLLVSCWPAWFCQVETMVTPNQATLLSPTV